MFKGLFTGKGEELYRKNPAPVIIIMGVWLLLSVTSNYALIPLVISSLFYAAFDKIAEKKKQLWKIPFSIQMGLVILAYFLAFVGKNYYFEFNVFGITVILLMMWLYVSGKWMPAMLLVLINILLALYVSLILYKLSASNFAKVSNYEKQFFVILVFAVGAAYYFAKTYKDYKKLSIPAVSASGKPTTLE